jgi:hypothetical protein
LVRHKIFDRFLTPSDSLNLNRKNAVFISEATLGAVALVGLNQLWYADYPRYFRFINDNADWLQMDKIGHFYSTYHLVDLQKCCNGAEQLEATTNLWI